jgi:hypothetical protein
MAKHRRMVARDGGWCEWVEPIMDGYRMTCCDCGLVHDMQFKVLRKGAVNPDGSWRARELDPENYRVSLRARRNPRSTAAVRRYQKPKSR